MYRKIAYIKKLDSTGGYHSSDLHVNGLAESWDPGSEHSCSFVHEQVCPACYTQVPLLSESALAKHVNYAIAATC